MPNKSLNIETELKHKGVSDTTNRKIGLRYLLTNKSGQERESGAGAMAL